MLEVPLRVCEAPALVRKARLTLRLLDTPVNWTLATTSFVTALSVTTAEAYSMMSLACKSSYGAVSESTTQRSARRRCASTHLGELIHAQLLGGVEFASLSFMFGEISVVGHVLRLVFVPARPASGNDSRRILRRPGTRERTGRYGFRDSGQRHDAVRVRARKV
jgi:hypothetical protein